METAMTLETAPKQFIESAIVRLEDGQLAEHWDVLQDEATRAEIPAAF
jgi:predicted SnoaL-like aldol condensation-catalyzing enzyme